MNFLAHAFLAPASDEALVGAFLGDFVKGPLANRFAPPLEHAISLHRSIDAFTDAHPLTLRSRRRISPLRRRYAGILIDVFYDHVLARTWSEYSDEALAQFAQRVYRTMLREHPRLPPRLQRMLTLMVEEDWLTHYRDPAAIERALQRIARRLSRPNPIADAIVELSDNRCGFEEDFRAFFPQLIAHASAKSAAR
ncbi:MAG TPA: ACP phosphodiesterase [Casimicrobiaceae bacterium]|nr:ACP phosphodiesterase [Casimicrobiaceae bacterium]